MTRHEEVYYTCNGCGTKLGDTFTDVVVTNTDEAAQQPEHDYQLCATCWLKVYKILDAIAIGKTNAIIFDRSDNDPWND